MEAIYNSLSKSNIAEILSSIAHTIHSPYTRPGDWWSTRLLSEHQPLSIVILKGWSKYIAVKSATIANKCPRIQYKWPKAY